MKFDLDRPVIPHPKMLRITKSGDDETLEPPGPLFVT
jgi:hypothetical protein